MAGSSETRTGDVSRVGDTWAVRAFLKLDALASGVLGVVLAALSVVLEQPLGLPVGLLVPAGLFLVAFAAGLWYLSGREAVRRAAVSEVILINVLWVVASVVVVIAGWFSPTDLGTVFILLQAAAVGGFAALQYAAVRRTGSAVR